MASSGKRNDSREPFFARLIRETVRPFSEFMDDAFSGRSSSDRGPVGLLTAPFRFLGGLAVFLVQAWASSRSGLKFVVGLPALGAIGLFLAGIWMANFYQNRLFGSAMAGFSQSAQLVAETPKKSNLLLQQRVNFARRMVELRPESEEEKYQLGSAVGLAGDIPTALDIMTMLAPDGQPGMSNAHLWRAGYYQNEDWFQASDDQRDEIVLKQLDLAIQQQEDNEKAHKNMSVIHLRKANTYEKGSPENREHLEKAMNHLTSMLSGGIQSVEHLLATMQVVEITRQLYGVDAARKTFDRIYTNHLEPVSKKRPNVFQIWLVLVKCAVALEDFPLAKKFVRDGFVTSNSNEVRKQIADLSSLVLMQEADISDDMTNPDMYQRRLYALTRAVNVNPKNDEIYKRLVKFIDSGTGDHFNMRWFEEAKVAAPDPGVLTTMLGLRAMMDGDVEKAKTHWRVSQQLYTLSELVLNHLIIVGTKTNQKDFSDPIVLLTKSLDAFPDNPFLLQSRGYFLIKEGDTQQAMRDLETAIEKLPNLVECRRFLILLYEKVGDATQAAFHQQKLDDTLSKMPDKKRETLLERLDRIVL
jgi:tetratricopeptide (TPR) repeat protein